MMPEMKTDFTRNDPYNASDLNRVGRAVQYLTELLLFYGYFIETAPKVDWADGYEPSSTELEWYLNDVKAIKARFYGQGPLPEAMRFLTAEGANNIEKLLMEVEGRLNNMIARFYYSNELYSGEVWE